MENRSKGKTRTGAGLSDAARPDERSGDELDELDSTRSASGSDEDDEPLLAEGESVGPWSDEEEEPNAFDAAAADEEDAREASGDEDAPAGYQAGGDEDLARSSHHRPAPKRRRSH